ncbi:MAG: NAD(P)-dependent alcohol dehydrogenase [Rhodobacteraceae bacterium]|nr:MAG: NAD(P)-dependent alcohol dehydrogenase [Paracoccaceae bacterium]
MKIESAICRHTGKLAIETVDLEEPRENEILVRTIATGICHTDISVMNQVLPAPLPIALGHEGAGIVEKIGAKVTNVAVGDHVVMTYDYCGTCPSCLAGKQTYCHNSFDYCFGGHRPDGSSPISKDGEAVGGSFFGQSSLATYSICYDRNVVKVRKDAPLELLGPLACGIQTGAGAVLNALKVEKGSDFAVFGAGAVGLSAIMAAKIAGARRIIAVDVAPERLALAKELGATDIINGATDDILEIIASLTEGGVMFALDTSGVPTVMQQAVMALAPRGTCGWLAGVSPDLNITVNPLFLLYGRSIRGIIEGDAHDASAFINKLIDWHMEGKFPFDKLIKTYPFSDLDTAIADSKSGSAIKPIVVFDT